MKDNSLKKFLESNYDNLLLPDKRSSAITKKAIKRIKNSKHFFQLKNGSSNKIKVKKAQFPIRKWHLCKIAESLVFEKHTKLIPFDGDADANYYMKIIYFLNRELATKLSEKNGIFGFEASDFIDTGDMFDNLHAMENVTDFMPNITDENEEREYFTNMAKEIESIKAQKKRNPTEKTTSILYSEFKSLRNQCFLIKEASENLERKTKELSTLEYKCNLADLCMLDANDTITPMLKIELEELKKEPDIKFEDHLKNIKMERTGDESSELEKIENLINGFAYKFNYTNYIFENEQLIHGISEINQLYSKATENLDEEKTLVYWCYHNYKYHISNERNPENFIKNEPVLTNEMRRTMYEFIINSHKFESEKIVYKRIILKLDKLQIFKILFKAFPNRIIDDFDCVPVFQILVQYIPVSLHCKVFRIKLGGEKIPDTIKLVLAEHAIEWCVKLRKAVAIFIKTIKLPEPFFKLLKKFAYDSKTLKDCEPFARNVVNTLVGGTSFSADESLRVLEIKEEAPYTMLTSFFNRSIKKYQEKTLSTFSDLKISFLKFIKVYGKAFFKRKKKWDLMAPAFAELEIDRRWYWGFCKKGVTASFKKVNMVGFIRGAVVMHYINICTNDLVVAFLSKSIFDYYMTCEYFGKFVPIETFNYKFTVAQEIEMLIRMIDAIYKGVSDKFKKLGSYYKLKNRTDKEIGENCSIFEIALRKKKFKNKKLGKMFLATLARNLVGFGSIFSRAIEVNTQISLSN